MTKHWNREQSKGGLYSKSHALLLRPPQSTWRPKMIDKARWTYNVSYMGRHSKPTCALLIRRLNVELKGIFITSQSLDHERIC